jgi:hypothetical protein
MMKEMIFSGLLLIFPADVESVYDGDTLKADEDRSR